MKRVSKETPTSNHKGNIDRINVSGIKNVPWPVTLFMFTLILPAETSFSIEDFRLTLYRVFLIIAFLPCFQLVFSQKRVKSTFTDLMMLFYGTWIIIALSINHGFSIGIKSGGVIVVESIGAYLLGRSYINSDYKYINLLNLFFIIITGLSFFTVFESLTGTNLLRPSLVSTIEKRLFLHRAFGPFDHPILYGVFCASIFSLRWFYFSDNLEQLFRRNVRTGWIVVAALMSVSTGALASIMIQFIFIAWRRVTRGVKQRWRLFSFILLLLYILIDLFSNRTPMRVILHRLTFSAATAYNRLTIWEWGTQYNVAENPWFGIGTSDWIRPSWMHSASMDNFWLVNMVRYGLPAFGFMAFGILHLMISIGKKSDVGEDIKRLRTGWLFSVGSLIISGCTVHFWNSLNVWFFFLLGAGAWMAQGTIEVFNES